MNDIDYMKEAIKLSKKALKLNEIPVGAIIIKNNTIIGKGYNIKETANNATMHAEIIALNEAYNKENNWRLVDSTLYTTLFPCPMCASAIQQSRIKKIYYLFDTKDIYSKEISMNIFNNNVNVVKVEKIDDTLFDNKLLEFFKKIR